MGKGLYIMFRLRYFTIVCNANKYKIMGQGASFGQLCNAHDEIKISKKHWLGLHIYHIISIRLTAVKLTTARLTVVKATT